MKLIYFYLFPLLFPFPGVPFFCCCFIFVFTFSTLLLDTLGGFFLFFCFFKNTQKVTRGRKRMEQAGILRKFIQGVKAMSEGDEERGEDNFGSDFMVGENTQEPPFFFTLHLSPPTSSLSLSPPFTFSTFFLPPRLPVPPCIPQEVRQGRPHCPLPFSPISRLYMAA